MKQLFSFFILYVLFIYPTQAQLYRIHNKLNATHFLNTEKEGDALSTGIEDAWWSAQWRIEPVGMYFRIVNKWRECALAVENEHLVCKSIDNSSQAQLWSIILGNGTSYTAILNVATLGYLHENATGRLSFHPDVEDEGAYWLFKDLNQPDIALNPTNQTPPDNSVTVITGIQTLSQAQKKEFVDLHNRERVEVGVGKIKWNEELAAYSAEWANHLASGNCALEHRPNNEYGENLFAGSAIYNKPSEIVGSWLEEKSQYKGGKIGDDFWAAGHYTQVIWAKSTEIGCAVATCANGYIIAVCNYNPAGNMYGESPLKK